MLTSWTSFKREGQDKSVGFRFGRVLSKWFPLHPEAVSPQFSLTQTHTHPVEQPTVLFKGHKDEHNDHELHVMTLYYFNSDSKVSAGGICTMGHACKAAKCLKTHI